MDVFTGPFGELLPEGILIKKKPISTKGIEEKRGLENKERVYVISAKSLK